MCGLGPGTMHRVGGTPQCLAPWNQLGRQTPTTYPQTRMQNDGCNQHPEQHVWRVSTEHLQSEWQETVSGRKGHWTESKPKFLTSTLLVLMLGHSMRSCRMSCSILDLYPTDARSVHCLVETTQIISRHGQRSPEGTLTRG